MTKEKRYDIHGTVLVLSRCSAGQQAEWSILHEGHAIYNEIHLINAGCLRNSTAMQVKNRPKIPSDHFALELPVILESYDSFVIWNIVCIDYVRFL